VVQATRTGGLGMSRASWAAEGCAGAWAAEKVERARWSGPTARATRGWGGLLNAARPRLVARRSGSGGPGVGEGGKRAGPAEAERRGLVWFSLFYFFFSLSTSFQT
jgi:hypothetical protein